MEKDKNKHPHWFEIKLNSIIQGLFACLGDEQKLYVVTVDPEEELKKIHNRFPRVIKV